MASPYSIRIELSKKCKFKFPPKDWKPSCCKAVKLRLADNANQSATTSSAKGGKIFSPWPILLGVCLTLPFHRSPHRGEGSKSRVNNRRHVPSAMPCPTQPIALSRSRPSTRDEATHVGMVAGRGHRRCACDHCAESRVGRVRIYGLPQGRQEKIWAALSNVRALRRIGLTRQTRKTPSSSLPASCPWVLGGSRQPAE